MLFERAILMCHTAVADLVVMKGKMSVKPRNLSKIDAYYLLQVQRY